jgi:hypothetical protein
MFLISLAFSSTNGNEPKKRPRLVLFKQGDINYLSIGPAAWRRTENKNDGDCPVDGRS